MSFLVRPDDWAIFIQNEDGTFSHSKSRMAEPYRWEKVNLLSWGFTEHDDSDLPIIYANQNLFSLYMLWHTRSDGHDGIKGGTMEEFMTTRPDLRIV